MRKLVCIFILFTNLVYAQTKIKGVLLDSLTHEPISFGNIIVKGTLSGATANEKGGFIIKSVMPVKLVISAVGYKTKEIVLKDTAFATIYLSTRAILLKEISIGSGKPEVLQKDNGFYYLDFDFYDDMILTLVGNPTGRTSQIQLLNEDGKIIASTKVPDNAERIFKDCLQNLHVLTPDSSYQIYYDYEHLRIMPAYSISVFNTYLVPCICELDSTYFFKNYSYQGLKLSFTYYKAAEKGKPYVLKQIADSGKIRDFNMQYDINYFLEQRRKNMSNTDPSVGEKGNYNTSLEEMKKDLDMYRENLPLSWAERQWLSPPEAELVKVGNAILIVDFKDSLIEKYNSKEVLSNAINFRIPRNANLIHHVFIDEDVKGAYIRAEKNGSSVIYKIDLEKGSLGNSTKVEGCTFIKGIKIKNGAAYFLYRDKGMGDPLKIHRVILN